MAEQSFPIIAYVALAAELAVVQDMKRLAQRIAERAADPGLSERTRGVLRRYCKFLQEA